MLPSLFGNHKTFTKISYRLTLIHKSAITVHQKCFIIGNSFFYKFIIFFNCSLKRDNIKIKTLKYQTATNDDKYNVDE